MLKVKDCAFPIEKINVLCYTDKTNLYIMAFQPIIHLFTILYLEKERMYCLVQYYLRPYMDLPLNLLM